MGRSEAGTGLHTLRLVQEANSGGTGGGNMRAIQRTQPMADKLTPDHCSSIMCSPPHNYCGECSHASFNGSAVVAGRKWRWEFLPRFGPLYLRADGEPMKRQPGEKHPVWDSFQKWFTKWDKAHPRKKVRT